MYRLIIDVELDSNDEIIGAKDIIATTLENIKGVSLVRVDEVIKIYEGEQTKIK